jgi:hypothetical protein
MAFVKYGVEWDDGISPVEIERRCIQKGGQWKWDNGAVAGLGLFQHFKNMESLLWPEDDHHRWSDLILSNILENRITVVCGCRDSSKTRTVSKWALCDYWCWPQETLILMTSTTAQGLEMRVFGDIKSLFARAKERFEFLEGNVVDAKKGIFTDNILNNDDVRDMRKGIVGIPTMTSEGEYQGMALKNFAGIKQKRRRLIGDELQFISCDYLKVLDSMDKGEFRGVFLGNMIADNGKALDRVAEPVNGWTAIDDAPKTKTWKNKYNGITINLCGPDSPNFDEETKDRFPYLLSQSDINSVAARPGGKDTVEWWSQIMGLRKTGVVSDRVLTIDMIQNNGGFKDVIWDQQPTMKICGVDAGYGGDDCVNTYIECGTEVGGVNVIKFIEQKVIPVMISLPISPEDQIALATKQDCDARGIPYENVYIEAGMRATLAVSFGRILSPSINAINFGGSATDRPVSNDLFIFDEKTQQRRLKKCHEHYSKFVSELAFSVRAVVESGQARTFPQPAAEEFQKRKWTFVYGDRYELESKVDYKERNQSKSPNCSDSVMVAVEGARRLGFAIERLKDPNAVEPDQTDWLEEEIMKERKFARQNELTYD